MKRYVAFLRGINISGKNKIPMAELKTGLEQLGFEQVKTYLNSGNAAFSSGEDAGLFVGRIENMLRERFGSEIPVFVTAQEKLADTLGHAPAWWGGGDKAVYHNLIFLLPPVTAEEVFRQLGAPKEGLEQVQPYGGAIFWSFSRKDYQKTNWWAKTASAEIGKKLTIRTAGTVRKAAEM